MTSVRTTPARLHCAGVSKTFGTARVLRSATLQVAPGEIHAVVGQNGSGKSTLVKILSGVHNPDRGAEITLDGRRLATPVRPADLRRAGMSFVHQDLGLVADKTVAENIGVGDYRRGRFGRIDWAKERIEAQDALERLGARLAPTARVVDLPAVDRFRVAIARAIRAQRPGEGVILFDESTRALSPAALDDFYQVIRQIKASGTSIVLVSHNLEEVVSVADRVTVLRDGQTVAAGLPTAVTTEADIARLMLGQDLDAGNRSRRPAPGPVAISVSGLAGGGLQGIDLEIGRGEIVGLTGLVGAGWERVPYLLSGAAPARGRLTIGTDSVELSRLTVRRAAGLGVALVPEGRADAGLAMSLSARSNVTLPRLTARGRPWLTGARWQADETAGVIRSLDVRPPDPNKIVSTFSGGNQQKLLLGKWLAGRPELLLLHEPTQAVDVGAREDILAILESVAARGTSVLVSSIQASDLAAICDRVIVLAGGRVRAELDGVGLTSDEIVEAVYGTVWSHR